LYEIEVDPDNLVAETNEENNVFAAGKPNVQITIEKIRVLSSGSNDAAGFAGCFSGLTGNIDIGLNSFMFDGTGTKMTYPTVGDWYRPHELGILVCPPQEFDPETELIPALDAGSCTAACSAYFGAHAQPIFAEGKHPTWLWITGWGTDYCSACYTLAGQTSVNRVSPVIDYAYAGGDLEIHTRMRNVDVWEDGATHYNGVCNFDDVIPAAEMAALPVMNRTLTDPGGGCEIVVSVEPFP
jgi:hypothetical protein